MNTRIITIIIISFFLIFSLLSCVVMKVPQPDSSRDTLLVVPLRIENNSDYPVSFEFTYKFLLKRGDEECGVYAKPPNPYKFVQGLKPGKYHIVKFSVIAVGTFKNYPLDIPIEIKAGKITLFPVWFVFIYTSTTNVITHSLDFEVIDLKMKREIVEDLKEHDNFVLWEFDY